MHSYRIYGQGLESEIPFPELRPGPASGDAWTFRVRPQGDAPDSDPQSSLLGEQVIYPGCSARLFRLIRGHRIAVDDTGTFDLAESNRLITWYPVPGATTDFGRGHLIGRVLATAMHQAGDLVLHGSAVAWPAGAAVFLAPKHSGKSTLALALTMAGARLISDDTIAVTALERDQPLVRPGVHSLRLFPDAVTRLAARADDTAREDGKRLVAGLAPTQLQDEPVPLAAVYLLVPAEAIDGGVAVARRMLPAPLAAAAMVGQGKISEMLGAAEGPVLLRRAARIASRVPVYQLAVERDLGRLPEVVTELGRWHQATGSTR